MLNAVSAITRPAELPPGPTPLITWLGAPPLGGQTGDFELYATKSAMFIEALAVGYNEPSDVRVRYRPLAGGGWRIAPELTLRDDDQANQYLQTIIGHRRGDVVEDSEYIVELVEKALIGTQQEATNTRRKTVRTWLRPLDQMPWEPETFIPCATAQEFIDAWNALVPGVNNTVLIWNWTGVQQMPPGQALNTLTGVHNVGVWAPNGWATTLSAATTEPLTWTPDPEVGADIWYTEDLPNVDQHQWLFVSSPADPFRASPLTHYDENAIVNNKWLDVNHCGWHPDTPRGRAYVKTKFRASGQNADPNELNIVGSTHPLGFRLIGCNDFVFMGTHWDGFNGLTGDDAPKPRGTGSIQNCLRATFVRFKATRCSRDVQMIDDNDDLFASGCLADYDGTYLNSQSLKASRAGDPPYIRPYPQEEVGSLFWQQGQHTTRGQEYEDCFVASPGEGIQLQDGQGTNSRRADRRQHAFCIRNFQTLNNIDGLNFDGHTSNVLVTESVLHGRGPVVSLAPHHYGRFDAFNCQLQVGFLPESEDAGLAKEIIHYTFAHESPGLGTNHWYNCTIVAFKEGFDGVPFQTDQGRNPEFSPASSMGNYNIWQMQETYPHFRSIMLNCVVKVFDTPPGGVSPRGWLLPFIVNGAFGDARSGDFEGVFLDHSLVQTTVANSWPVADNDGPGNQGQWTLAGFKAAREPEWNGIGDNNVEQVDPELDANRIAQAQAAIDVYSPIPGLDFFDRAGASRPFEFVRPTTAVIAQVWRSRLTNRGLNIAGGVTP